MTTVADIRKRVEEVGVAWDPKCELVAETALEMATSVLDDPGAKRLGGFNHRQTSRAAALANYPRSGSQRERVLVAFREAYPEGLTDFELEQQLGIHRQILSNRRGELVHGAWVRDSGDLRAGWGGVDVIVWELTPEGRTRLGLS